MRIRGAIEKKTARNVNGWLAITEEPGPITIEVLHVGKIIGKIEASELRPDVRQAGFGDGHSGIAFKMPPSLEDANPEDIELRLLGTEIYLSCRRGEAPVEKPTLHGEGSVFILGPARSGTSVMFLALQKVLGLSGLGESHVPQIFQRMVFQFYEYVKSFAGNDGVLAHRLQVADFRGCLIRYLRQFYFEQFAGAPFVDKTPGLEALVGVPFLREAFPAAKIIVMERNGIETIESYRRKFGATFDEALKEWAECARESEKLRRTTPDILFLTQEQLQSNPEEISHQLSRYIEHGEKSGAFTEFFTNNYISVTRSADALRQRLTMETVGWTAEQIASFSRVSIRRNGESG